MLKALADSSDSVRVAALRFLAYGLNPLFVLVALGVLAVAWRDRDFFVGSCAMLYLVSCSSGILFALHCDQARAGARQLPSTSYRLFVALSSGIALALATVSLALMPERETALVLSLGGIAAALVVNVAAAMVAGRALRQL